MLHFSSTSPMDRPKPTTNHPVCGSEHQRKAPFGTVGKLTSWQLPSQPLRGPKSLQSLVRPKHTVWKHIWWSSNLIFLWPVFICFKQGDWLIDAPCSWCGENNHYSSQTVMLGCLQGAVKNPFPLERSGRRRRWCPAQKLTLDELHKGDIHVSLKWFQFVFFGLRRMRHAGLTSPQRSWQSQNIHWFLLNTENLKKKKKHLTKI